MQYQNIPESWRPVLEPVLRRPQVRMLTDWLAAEDASGKSVYPPPAQRLKALELTPLSTVKAVILGQDPYHGTGQAHGLSFSVPPSVKIPPSLVNIYKELQSDLGIAPAAHGNLVSWARAGVLLLNTSLTVEAHNAGSHAGKGWDHITDAIVAAVAQQPAPSVFILWGSHAQKTMARIGGGSADSEHLILNSPHPSPLSAYRGFFGSRPFSKANAFLEHCGRGAIDWSLPPLGSVHIA